jgi:glycosyltransferase involved in cell wall biosynthesis
MNILLLTSEHSKNNFGITSVVSQLADQLASTSNGIGITIAAVGNISVEQSENVAIEFLPIVRWGMLWRWSPNIIKKISEMVERNNIQVIHIHGIWMAIQWAGLVVAKKKKIPCIISVHGMLEKWFWNEQSFLKKLKKKIYLDLVLKPNISSNTVFHAITLEEFKNIKRFFPDSIIKIIPNAITFASRNNSATQEKNIVFLGRLHPIKGVDLLIQAFTSIVHKEWQLVIAGPEEDYEYVNKLKKAISDNSLEEQIHLIGPVFGDEKAALLQRAWVVVVPSYSEVIGMVNLEAALNQTSSITTFETGLLNWEESGGLLVHPTVDSLQNALTKVMNWTFSERKERGQLAYAYVKKHFSWEVVIPTWRQLYSDVLQMQNLEKDK